MRTLIALLLLAATSLAAPPVQDPRTAADYARNRAWARQQYGGVPRTTENPKPAGPLVPVGDAAAQAQAKVRRLFERQKALDGQLRSIMGSAHLTPMRNFRPGGT